MDRMKLFFFFDAVNDDAHLHSCWKIGVRVNWLREGRWIS